VYMAESVIGGRSAFFCMKCSSVCTIFLFVFLAFYIMFNFIITNIESSAKFLLIFVWSVSVIFFGFYNYFNWWLSR